MIKLQEFIEKHYSNKDIVEEINISEQSLEIWNELARDDLEVKGKEVDLRDYIQLKKLKINSERLVSSIKTLTLNNPKLTELVILNNNGLDKLDISGCSELASLKLNDNWTNKLPYILAYSLTKVVGWEDTKLYDKGQLDRLQGILRDRLKTKGEESWKDEDDMSSISSDDESCEWEEELVDEAVEVLPKNNN